MFKPLDPILHSELRLAVMSLLLGVEEADFTYIKEQTNATAGNLSVQIDKLSTAGYIEVEKKFEGKRPCTTCRITQKGVEAFDNYVETLKEATLYYLSYHSERCRGIRQLCRDFKRICKAVRL